MKKNGLTSIVRRLGKHESGVAAVELALALPILLLIFSGLVETGHFFLLNLKLQHAATSVADLTTRDQDISEATIADIFTAVPQIITPYPVGDISRVYVSGISASDTEPARIIWQRNGSGTLDIASPLGNEGDSPSLPPELTLRPNETIVVSEVFYEYEPLFFPVIEPQTLRRISYFRPRIGTLQTIRP